MLIVAEITLYKSPSEQKTKEETSDRWNWFFKTCGFSSCLSVEKLSVFSALMKGSWLCDSILACKDLAHDTAEVFLTVWGSWVCKMQKRLKKHAFIYLDLGPDIWWQQVRPCNSGNMVSKNTRRAVQMGRISNVYLQLQSRDRHSIQFSHTNHKSVTRPINLEVVWAHIHTLNHHKPWLKSSMCTLSFSIRILKGPAKYLAWTHLAHDSYFTNTPELDAEMLLGFCCLMYPFFFEVFSALFHLHTW